jgi:ankyrin repeat protein
LKAVYSGECEQVVALLAMGADPNTRSTSGDMGKGNTALMLAAGSQSICTARALLDRGADINEFGGPSPYALSPLMLATTNTDPKMVQFLLSRHANVNAHNNNGVTALMCATSLQVAAELILYGANVNASTSDTGYTALIQAADADNLPLVKLLIKKGANANVKEKDNGYTALTYAERDKDWPMVRLLKKADAKR